MPALLAAGGLWLLAAALCAGGAEPASRLTVRWDQVLRESKTIISIQDCPEPPLFRGKPTHDPIYKALRDLKADYARLQPWHCYPRLAVAELEPAKEGRTSWDFKLLDEVVADFMEAAEGRPVVFTLSTTPQWLWQTAQPVRYPSDPEEITWEYIRGTELCDPTLQQLTDYYTRVANWYIRGGFEDEFGRRHESGHHYRFACWEVLNEVDIEHNLSPELYTRVYDSVVKSLRKVDPEMKFAGLALAGPMGHPEYFEYFLNHANHEPGIPLDMVSYHFYSQTDPDAGPDVQQFTIFEQAEKFATAVRLIEAIRQRLSPQTRTYIDEIGSFLPDALNSGRGTPIPDSYWSLAGAMWACLYIDLAQMGIDVVAGAELIDYPAQYACTSLLDWNTGKPNARYRVLKLLRENCLPGDKFVRTEGPGPAVRAQGLVFREGVRKILIVNRRDRPLTLAIRGLSGARLEMVDQTTGFQPPAVSEIEGERLELRGLAVGIATLK